jgi:uncharacterized CHY-type Zn-finger protein
VICGMSMPRPSVRVINLDSQARCIHYRTDADIIAIKMKCRGIYYACKDCHEALADHPIEVWLRNEWDQLAVFCGACSRELRISDYLQSVYTCPACQAEFTARPHPMCEFQGIRGFAGPPWPRARPSLSTT